ncbi:MAG: ABC transporter permease [Treponema sp.]|jgi:NitT/TauT family transport system permease protein/sulfonate transport system permease protein|nr:ABC transporter permease [Treponema sp.]
MKKDSNFLNTRFAAVLFAALSIIAFLIVWQLAVSFTRIGRLIPGPIAVLVFFFRSFVNPIGRYTMLMHAYISLRRVMIGYIIGIALGIVAGVGMGVSKTFEAVFKPIFEMLRPIPTIAWIPLAILWFGVGETTKHFIIFYGTFANVTLNAYSGVQRVDPVLLGAAKMLGAADRQLLPKVILPACVPSIFAGMQTGLSAGWMGVIAAEMVKSSEGLGWIIIMGQETASTTQILSGMVAIAVIGLLLATAMRILERRLCRWNERTK